MIKLVVFDLDNVIIDGEAIDEIGKLVNKEEQISELTEKAMQGEIDFKTSIIDRVKLLEGISLEDVEKVANDLPLMKGADETFSSLKEKGLDIAIISGSFDIIANPLKEKLGVDYVFTNHLIDDDGKLTGNVEGLLVDQTKLEILNSLIEDKDISLDEVIAVGDGANDISMVEAAKCGIAFNAKPQLKEVADIVVEDKDLTKILDIVDEKYSDDVSENDVESSDVADDVESSGSSDDVESSDVADDVESSGSSDDVESSDVADDVESSGSSDDAESSKKDTEASSEEKNKDADSNKNKEIISEFVLADTIEGVRDQKNEKELLIANIADEREEYNQIAKEQRKIRDELNDSLKENLNKAIEFRNERNEINKDVEEAKRLRNDVNNKIKNLEWSSGKRDKIKIENEIKKIDKIIETRVLDIKKENQLVKNANDLRKQLMEIHEDESVKGQAQGLKKESEDHHAIVVELSEKAQKAHENMLIFFKKTDEIRTAADDAHKKFIDARKNASDKHEDFKKVLSDIHVINKKLGTQKPRRKRSDKKSSSGNNKNREEKERAEAIFDKFKKGKKLSTEELLLLQKYNIG